MVVCAIAAGGATSAGATTEPPTPSGLAAFDIASDAYLGGKVRELPFHLLAQQTRITYWLAPGRRLILLTVFRKTRNAEIAEVARALHAQKTCEADHGLAHDTFDREAR
jgi:hypothetical protein